MSGAAPRTCARVRRNALARAPIARLRVTANPKLLPVIVACVLAACVLTACANSESGGDGLSAGLPPVTQDAATRTEPVVAGRPARVFIFAGLGDTCEALPPPEVAILNAPAKGDLSFVPNQETAIKTSAQGTCIGRVAKGTAVYYTAREGATGTDRFAVSAKLGKSDAVTRSFEVTIAQ